MSSAAVVIGALKVKSRKFINVLHMHLGRHFEIFCLSVILQHISYKRCTISISEEINTFLKEIVLFDFLNSK